MPDATLSQLVEYRIIQYLSASGSWDSTPTFLETLGAQLAGNPIVKINVTGSREEPYQSGNHFVDVRAELSTSMEPDTDLTYDEAMTSHNKNAGAAAALLGDMAPSNLDGSAPTAYDNSLKVFDIHLGGFEREIVEQYNTFTDVWDLTIYCHNEG
tara:strand:- start:873 stop:1337 length:465 start_codon:yes stop_codon:yes gene_type:complete